METTTTKTNHLPERTSTMTTNSPTVADLTNVTPGGRAAREVFTALVRDHQRELEERGVPTGPDAGPAPAADLAHLTLPDLLVKLFKAQEASQDTDDLQAELDVRQANLEAAFKIVRPARDWKTPISVVRTAAQVEAAGGIEIVAEAIVHFTATEPSIDVSDGGKLFAIQADGYRAGPAGDH